MFAVAATFYDRFMGRYLTQLSSQLADLASVEAGQRVLDVGCGPGALTGELVKRLGATAVSAIDPSEPFVRIKSISISAHEITAAVLRGLPIEDLKREIVRIYRKHPALSDGRALLRELIRGSGDKASPEILEKLGRAERAAYRNVASLADVGLRKYPDQFWRDVGVAYLRALVREPRKAVEAMAERFDKPIHTVRGWIKRAREEGWLSEATHGRAGADPGPRLVEWLEGQA